MFDSLDTNAFGWRPIAALAVLGLAAFLPASALAASDDTRIMVTATDSRIHLTGGLDRVKGDDGSVHFDRRLDSPERGFRWDSPGARMRWRTDSPVVCARLRYSARHIGTSRNSKGHFRIDGRSKEEWAFTRPKPGDVEVKVLISAPDDRSFHDYEVILPYGDSVDLLGVEVADGAQWEDPAPTSETRYLAFGDSVTHGFTASSVLRSYAFLTAELNDWDLLNLGIGGRGTYGPDGAFIADIEADVISVLIGVNDWQAGAPLASFRDHYSRLLDGLTKGHPEILLFVITPLWVPPSWEPAMARYPLEDYREQIRELVAARANRWIALIEGPSLIDHDPAYFDPIAVHPNDAGFAQMAERLSRSMRQTAELPRDAAKDYSAHSDRSP